MNRLFDTKRCPQPWRISSTALALQILVLWQRFSPLRVHFLHGGVFAKSADVDVDAHLSAVLGAEHARDRRREAAASHSGAP